MPPTEPITQARTIGELQPPAQRRPQFRPTYQVRYQGPLRTSKPSHTSAPSLHRPHRGIQQSLEQGWPRPIPNRTSLPSTRRKRRATERNQAQSGNLVKVPLYGRAWMKIGIFLQLGIGFVTA